MENRPTAKDLRQAVQQFAPDKTMLSHLTPQSWKHPQPDNIPAFDVLLTIPGSYQEDVLEWLGIDHLVKASRHYPEYESARRLLAASKAWSKIMRDLRPQFEARIQELTGG